jgi:hypothetical protein
MKNYEEFTPTYIFIPKEEGDESGVFGIGLNPSPVEPEEDGGNSKDEESFTELIKSCLKKVSFWKKEESDIAEPQHNEDTGKITVLNKSGDNITVIYVHTSNPPKNSDVMNAPLTPMALLMGTGASKYHPTPLVDLTPPISDEERAAIEAEKQEKARLHEDSAKLSGIPITEEEAEAYIQRRWNPDLVRSFDHGGGKGKEYYVSVWVHCHPSKRFGKKGFTRALEALNPDLFHEIIIDDEDGYWGWDDTRIYFKGASGTLFEVTCYKVRRGDFYIDMGAGLHGGETPITAENFAELEAVIEVFKYFNSLPPTLLSDDDDE